MVFNNPYNITLEWLYLYTKGNTKIDIYFPHTLSEKLCYIGIMEYVTSSINADYQSVITQYNLSHAHVVLDTGNPQAEYIWVFILGY